MSNYQAINLLTTVINNNICSTGYNNVSHPAVPRDTFIPLWNNNDRKIINDACSHIFYPVTLTFNNKEETFCSGSIALYLTTNQEVINKIYHTNCGMKHPSEKICWYSIRTGNSKCFSDNCKFLRIIRPCRIEPPVTSTPPPSRDQLVPQLQFLPPRDQLVFQLPSLSQLPSLPQLPSVSQLPSLPPRDQLVSQLPPLPPVSQLPPLPPVSQLPPLPPRDQLVPKALCNSCSLFKEESIQKEFIMNNLIKNINGFRLASNNKLELRVVYGNNNIMWLNTSIYWGRNYILMQCYLKINAKEINILLASNNYDILIQEQDGYIRSLNYNEIHPGKTQTNVESGRNLPSNLPLDRTRGRSLFNKNEHLYSINRDRSRSRERPNSYIGPFRDSYYR